MKELQRAGYIVIGALAVCAVLTVLYFARSGMFLPRQAATRTVAQAAATQTTVTQTTVHSQESPDSAQDVVLIAGEHLSTDTQLTDGIIQDVARASDENLTASGQQTADNLQDVTQTAGESRTVTLAFTGDILFDDRERVMQAIRARGGSVLTSFDDTIFGVLRGADVTVVNNEFPYSDRGTPTPDKMYTFRAHPSHARKLQLIGVDLALLANNHTFDHGEIALLDTLDTLDAIGLARIGAGRNLGEAAQAYHYENGDVRIAILNATQIEGYEPADTRGATADRSGVFRSFDPTLLSARIAEEKAAGYFVIVCVHWGDEKTTELNYGQTHHAAVFAEAGADLIVGAHPHILQQIDYVGGVPVIYSLGNFLFNSTTLPTAVLTATVDAQGLREVRLIPAIQENCAVRIATPQESAAILGTLNSLSATAVLDAQGVLTPR